jgi:hypothetical protein
LRQRVSSVFVSPRAVFNRALDLSRHLQDQLRIPMAPDTAAQALAAFQIASIELEEATVAVRTALAPVRV